MNKRKRLLSPFRLLCLLIVLSYSGLSLFDGGVLVWADHHEEALQTRDRCFYVSGLRIDVFSPREKRSYLLLTCPMVHKFEEDIDACADRASDSPGGSILVYQGNDYDCAR